MEIYLKDGKQKISGALLLTALTDVLSGIAEGASKTTVTMGYIIAGTRKVMISIEADAKHELIPEISNHKSKILNHKS